LLWSKHQLERSVCQKKDLSNVTMKEWKHRVYSLIMFKKGSDNDTVVTKKCNLTRESLSFRHSLIFKSVRMCIESLFFESEKFFFFKESRFCSLAHGAVFKPTALQNFKVNSSHFFKFVKSARQAGKCFENNICSSKTQIGYLPLPCITCNPQPPTFIISTSSLHFLHFFTLHLHIFLHLECLIMFQFTLGPSIDTFCNLFNSITFCFSHWFPPSPSQLYLNNF